MWPVNGVVTRGFDGSREKRHAGIDIASPLGTPIKTAEGGRVIYSGNEIKGYGNVVIVKHGPVFSSVYAHNAENMVREGDVVQKGQSIARVGRTGRAQQAHLHFEIRNHGRPMDPLLVLP
jgi:lipoprotein NlpD